MSELLEKILSKDNMNAAYKRVCANKGANGVDGVTVEELGEYIKENWDNIREQIRHREYSVIGRKACVSARMSSATVESWTFAVVVSS